MKSKKKVLEGDLLFKLSEESDFKKEFWKPWSKLYTGCNELKKISLKVLWAEYIIYFYYFITVKAFFWFKKDCNSFTITTILYLLNNNKLKNLL